jgi:hypothetical protein
MALPPTSWPITGSGIGLGFPGYEQEPAKKFTSAECLTALVDHLKANPQEIQNQITLVSDDMVKEFRAFWPDTFVEDNWTRVSTHRPTHDETGEKLLGTDREVRVYENDIWLVKGHSLECSVTTEHGDVQGYDVVAKW